MKIIIKKRDLVPATDDRIFKALMISNKEYLSDIISGVTGIDKEFVINNLIIKNSELLIYSIDENRRTSDLIVEVKDNLINIEMNRFYYKKLTRRNNFYLYKMASLYEKETNTFIQINLDNFNKSKNIITKYEMMNIEELESDGSLIKYNINLALIEEKYYNGINLTKFEKELLLLRLENKEDLNKISKGDELMKKVNDKIIFLNDEKIKELEYDYDEKIRFEAREVGYEEGFDKGLEDGKKQGIKQGIKQGLEQGIEKGIKQKSIDIAVKMLKNHIPIDDIVEYTNLSKEEIEKISLDN